MTTQPAGMYPRWPFIWYGDGSWAECHGKVSKLDDNGVQGWEMYINTSLEIRNKFQLRVGEDLDPNTGLITKWYPAAKVAILSDDPVLGRILVYTDFNGGETSFSRRESYYIEQLIDLQKQIKILRAGKAKVYEDYLNSLTQMNTQIEKFAEIQKTIAKANPPPQNPMMPQQQGEYQE